MLETSVTLSVTSSASSAKKRSSANTGSSRKALRAEKHTRARAVPCNAQESNVKISLNPLISLSFLVTCIQACSKPIASITVAAVLAGDTSKMEMRKDGK